MPSVPPAVSAIDDALPRGTMVGRYVIVDVIGHGGMGVVYSAYDTQLDRKLAIKLLRPDLVAGMLVDDSEARLLREAQAMARLTHPNVVAVHDVGSFEHRVFLAMDYVDGTTLKGWLRAKPRSMRERLDVLRAAGRGLAAAHHAGLVHRDFKPDNVLVGRDGRVLVTDFGLARAQGDRTPEAPLPPRPPQATDSEGSGRSFSSLDSQMTETGNILGTVGYLAPEQAWGGKTGASADQFSFAATAYFALYGDRPFPSHGLAEYLAAVELPVPDPPKGARVPAWIRRVLLRGLSYRPEARFPSLDALLDALDADPVVRWKRVAWGISAGMVVVLPIGLGVWMARQREAECAPDPNDLAGVWGDAMRRDVKRAFEATDVEAASGTADRVIARIDDYVARWAQMRGDLCRAARVRKQQPEDAYGLRMDCLDRQRSELRSVSKLLVNADAQVVKKSIDVVYGLPQVAWCTDLATLRASAGLPDDPVKRTKVLEVRDQLAEVKSLNLAGKYAEAAKKAHAVAEAARGIDHRSTLADVLFEEAQIQLSLGSYSDADPLLREAIWMAYRVGADVTVVRGASLESFVVGTKLLRPLEGHNWIDQAHASLDRIGTSANEELELDVLSNEAILLADGELHPESAVPLMERVVAGYRRLLGVNPKTSRAIYNLGGLHDDLGELALERPLFEEALSMEEALNGPSHSRTAIRQYGLGACLVGLGEFAAGEAMLEKARGIFEKKASTFWLVSVVEVLIQSRVAQGDSLGAIRYAERAVSLVETIPDVAGLAADIFVAAGSAMNEGGRFNDALALCNRAIDVQVKSAQGDTLKAYGKEALRCKGEALLGLGRPDEATVVLERSITLKRRAHSADYARAEFALARSLVALHKDPARALALAKSAREEMGRSPYLKVEIGRIDALLRALGR